jgi:hypothetical protein
VVLSGIQGLLHPWERIDVFFYGEHLKTRNRFVDPRVDMRIVLKRAYINRLLCGDWIQVAGRRVQWLDRVNKAPKRHVSCKEGKFVPH